MKILSLSLIITLLIVHDSKVFAQSPNLEWAFSTSDAFNSIWTKDILIDFNGDIYETGYFRGEIDFDPSSMVTNFSSLHTYDAFIRKLDTNGNLLWVKPIASLNDVIGLSLATDANGNLYIIGRFKGSVDFDLGPGVHNVIGIGVDYYNTFILKLDANGDFLWVRTYGPANIYDSTVDAAGNIYMTGYFFNSLDFDPGAGNYTLSASGNRDVFILSLDANGDFRWVKSIGNSGDDIGVKIKEDELGGIYIAGIFKSTVDFDPNAGISDLSSNGRQDIFLQKLDTNGNFLWAKSFGGSEDELVAGLAVDHQGNILVIGSFIGTVDFNPGTSIFNISSVGIRRGPFVLKLNTNGDFVWAVSFVGSQDDIVTSIDVDSKDNIYVGGTLRSTLDLDPGPGVFSAGFNGANDAFLVQLDSSANFVWAETFGGDGGLEYTRARVEVVRLDASDNIYVTGDFNGIINFSPNGHLYLSNLGGFLGGSSYFLKYQKNNIIGSVYLDYNQDCILDPLELGLANQDLVIQPGNIMLTTNMIGRWTLDNLPVGNYSIAIDTTGWMSSCLVSYNFTVVHPDSLVEVNPIGLFTLNSCSEPDVSILAPSLNAGATERVYLQACNGQYTTESISNAYVLIQLDPLFVPQMVSLPYLSLGNDLYRVDIGTLSPDSCVNFWMDCLLSSSVTLGQTICMKAQLYPLDSCALDTIPNYYHPFNSYLNVPFYIDGACTTTYDNSSLTIEGACVNDEIIFIIKNLGSFGIGDMTCTTPVRGYKDGILVFLDTLKLNGGDTAMYTFDGDGQTWRMEVDQHAEHPGNSRPNATVERCDATFSNDWTPGLVNTMSSDDADPNIDIYCGVVDAVIASNSKVGYPLGVTSGINSIIPINQPLNYVIRFQNTGADTVNSIIIRDTIDPALDIFSINHGAASHAYSFEIFYGSRVIEWTINNLQLPNAITNTSASQGFVSFTVDQLLNNFSSARIKNSATIYFDSTDTISTNQTIHNSADYYLYTFTEVHYIASNVEPLEVSVYPNPSTGLVFIESELDEELTISVVDNLGRQLLIEKYQGTQGQVDLCEFSSGIYYFTITNGKKTRGYKVVKN